MPRFKLKKLTIRKPPSTVAQKVVLDRAAPSPSGGAKPKHKPVLIVRMPKRGDNVIKPRPKPIAELAKAKSATIDARVRSRERYRESAGVVMDSCLDNLDEIENMAHLRTVTFPNGSAREVPTFTLTEMGKPLNTSGATFTRWVKRGMVPEPFLETSRGKVYHIEEARSLVRIIGAHQREFRQYRDEHENVKNAIFDASSTIRRGLFPPK